MNRDRTNKIIAFGMLVIIVVSMMNYSVVVVEKVRKYLIEKNESAESIVITEDVEIIESINTEENEVSQNSELTFYQTFYQKIISVQETIEKGADEVTFKNGYIVLHTFLQSLLGKQTYVDGGETVALMDNGYLTMVYNEEQDTDLYADNLIALNEYLNEKDIGFLYVQAPYKVSMYDDQLPIGVELNMNEVASDLLNGIDGKVNYIDLRVEMYEDNMDQYEYFFKTDHHWLPEAGFWAFTVIAELLNSEYGFNIDESVMDINNYNIEVYEDWFLGSVGKRVGPYLIGVDDISIITPDFETELSIEIPSIGMDNQGSYEEILIDYTLLDEIDYWNDVTYTAYICGVEEFICIKNLNSECEKKILVIADSYVRTVSPFLALGCSQVDLIDLRFYKEMSLVDYLEINSNYDMIIMLLNPSAFSEKVFTFDEVYY